MTLAAEDAEVAGWIEAMRRHVAEAPEVYRPGAFWADLLERNLAMLRADGIRRFKRTVNNNFYNWLVTSWLDPQLRNAVVGWLRRKHERTNWHTLRSRYLPR